MDHRRGKDPIPQGRIPGRKDDGSPASINDPVSEKYENSAPGPDAKKDGAYFFGYKREGIKQEGT